MLGMDGYREKRGVPSLGPPALETIPTPILIGETTAKNNLARIWDYLMDENVRKIGVCGMGGVGKTTLIKHIYNWVLENKSKAFKYAYWVTVSQEFKIFELQKRIANAIGVDLSHLVDVNMRAAKMFKEFKEKEDFVLILDDVWRDFSLEDVGVWFSGKRSKLIISTRMVDVCIRMDCQVIRVEPLRAEESWELFMKNLRHYDGLSVEVKEIAKLVANECAGLPLAIVTIAKSMAGVVDIHGWRDAQKNLEESRALDEEDQVFERMKFSYNRLPNEMTKNCLLYCALYPEDYEFERQNLIRSLVDEGLIDQKGLSFQERSSRAATIVNKLINSCLLESGTDDDGDPWIKMHDVIRDMALRIKFGMFLVKAGVQLKELPDVEYWDDDLEKVSLVKNDIREIPGDISPECPQLSTLLLSGNLFMHIISGSFFVNMYSLRVLDLSNTDIGSLPVSVTHMRTLTTLVLRECLSLQHMPSLQELRALLKLDLYSTSVCNVPLGTDKLVNLRILNLGGTRIEVIPDGLLGKLSRLECLLLGSLVANVEEVMSLRKLEILECGFKDGDDYGNYVRWCNNQDKRVLTNYYLHMASYCVSFCSNEYTIKKEVILSGRRFIKEKPKSVNGNLTVVVPIDMKELYLEEFNYIGNICDLDLQSSETFNYDYDITTVILQSLESLDLFYMRSLNSLLLPSSPATTFSLLKKLDIEKCPKIKKLFPPGLLLTNLQELEVCDCDSMEEIFAAATANSNFNHMDGGSIGEDHIVLFTLPKLKELRLSCLRSLKSICGQRLFVRCDSIRMIRIFSCPKLKRMQLYMPIDDNAPYHSPPPLLKCFSVVPKEYWHSLDWDHPFSIPNRFSKSLLNPFLHLWFLPEQIYVAAEEEEEEEEESSTNNNHQGSVGEKIILYSHSPKLKQVAAMVASTIEEHLQQENAGKYWSGMILFLIDLQTLDYLDGWMVTALILSVVNAKPVDAERRRLGLVAKGDRRRLTGKWKHSCRDSWCLFAGKDSIGLCFADRPHCEGPNSLSLVGIADSTLDMLLKMLLYLQDKLNEEIDYPTQLIHN
ncbi:Leucine-rich repeat [Dillenia turbinata]|uniref:Leucine-rich repeat n=1 Tax=Dillenia turbinata TaxID=194707 RepID=A0AAN8ZTZ0_9MAGN